MIHAPSLTGSIRTLTATGAWARFVMNVMLASGGYSWTVIRVEDRDAYLAALERGSIEMDIKPFSAFVAQRVKWSLEGRDLKFPAPREGYVFDRDVVVFWAQDGDKHVRCEISRAALDDHFHGDGKDKLEVFRANRAAIEQEARRKYLAGRTEAGRAVLIRTMDLVRAPARRQSLTSRNAA